MHSFLVAADATCSSGDLPVVTEDRALAAVEGLATATATALLPTELAAAVLLLPRARRGAAQPVNAPPKRRMARTLNMKVKLLNDGPVTIVIDSKNRE